MSVTLVDNIRSVFTTDVLAKVSVLLGETEVNVQKAIHAAVPLVLTDILHKAYFPEPIARVWELSQQATTRDFYGELHELSVSAGGLVPGSLLLNQGAQCAKALFVGRLDPVVNETSRYAGVSVPSASFIVGVVSFAALDALGRHITTHNTDAAGLAQWLKAQGESIRMAAPAGLEVKHALGIEHYPWDTPARKRRRNMAVYIALVLLVIGAVIFFIVNGHHRIAAAGPLRGVLTMSERLLPSYPVVAASTGPLS
jgi:hypothetical protein